MRPFEVGQGRSTFGLVRNARMAATVLTAASRALMMPAIHPACSTDTHLG
ncbi:hypothetical protein [Micromonospora parva]